MSQQSVSTTRYFTKDTLLATWLYMNGLKLDDVTGEDTAQFIFSTNPDDLNHLLEEFNNGNPHGNVITFFRSYKYLLAQIKGR
jgi:hypothetical protein